MNVSCLSGARCVYERKDCLEEENFEILEAIHVKAWRPARVKESVTLCLNPGMETMRQS